MSPAATETLVLVTLGGMVAPFAFEMVREMPGVLLEGFESFINGGLDGWLYVNLQMGFYDCFIGVD